MYTTDHGRAFVSPSREYHVNVSPKGVTASPGVKVQGVLNTLARGPRSAPTRDTGSGPVKRTLIATYPGTSFSAERNEDGSLSIYHTGDENMATSLDRHVTAAQLQKRNEAARVAR